MSLYYVTHHSNASLLRYFLGDAAHLRTFKRRDGRLTFEFDDPEGKAPELTERFFSPEGIAVGNARDLLNVDRSIRLTIGKVHEHGEWRDE